MDVDEFLALHRTAIDQIEKGHRSVARSALPYEVTGRAASLLESRAGGPVAWPSGHTLPCDPQGNPMIFVMQIDLSALPPLPDFPRKGLLQLFVTHDIAERGITFSPDQFEAGFFPLAHGDGFRLEYHRDTKGLAETPYQIPAAEHPVAEQVFAETPVKLAIWDSVRQPPPFNNWHAEALSTQLEALINDTPDAPDYYDIVEAFGLPDLGTTIGGYAQPMQLDQRSFFPEYQSYDRLLLGLWEFDGFDVPSLAMHILINTPDLKEARFDQTIMIADAD
ncbi:DUF1963 domain-containing protein [Primorskyibacter sp. 2E233]|uniref:DUF1963 domain-containing protein n=1 Tax=Primorskyibacter sp. 2E233 TaxID=3413431 RepID=UPI003BF247C5